MRTDWSQNKAATYGMAVASTAAVLLARLALMQLTDLVEVFPFLLFALPVVVSAWVGGLGPGLLATVLTTLCVGLILLPADWRPEMRDGDFWGVLTIYAAQGLLISLLGHGKERALAGLRQAHAELEQRVRERTAELRTANQRLEGLNAALELRNRELQDFAYVASHDLQEPLRKIVAFGERLHEESTGALGERSVDYLRRMQAAAVRMQTLIDDLLSYSRVTTKGQPFTRVDLGRVAAEVLGDLEERIARSQARVEVDELPMIEADPTQMRQLMQNLVGNALKFRRPEEAPVVRVRARPADGAGDGAVELLVEDNGIGFDEKYLDRIFTVFQRLHGRGVYEGTGVGLAICRKIAERHRGSITARSRPGEGSTFIVTLPVRQSETEGVANAA